MKLQRVASVRNSGCAQCRMFIFLETDGQCNEAYQVRLYLSDSSFYAKG